MTTPAIQTIIKMVDTLPEAAQNQVADHLREYIATMQDEATWDDLFARSQDKLAESGRRAKQQIAECKASRSSK